MFKAFAGWCAVAVAAVAPILGYAQTYPTRTIKWIVPVPAGTSPDTTARVLAEKMGPSLGQPIVVENIPGAGGNIGAGVAAKAPGDGYTWFFATSPMAVNMKLFKTPGYDAMKSFKHVSHIADYDNVIVVNANSPYKTLEDLTAAIKKNPGKLNYSSGGLGTPTHIVPALMLKAIRGDAVHVPFKGGSESINALLGGHVDFAVPVTQVGMNYVRSGQARALAVSSANRNPIAPDVPTLKEKGIAVTLVSFSGLSVPASTPPQVVARIDAALKEALAKRDVVDQLTGLGLAVSPSTSGEFTRMVQDEITQAQRTMAELGMEQQ